MQPKFWTYSSLGHMQGMKISCILRQGIVSFEEITRVVSLAHFRG